MKKIIKFLGLITCSFMFICLLVSLPISAAENIDRPAAPEFSLSLINKGTGVKITISKTDGAEGYLITILRDNIYNDYTHNRIMSNEIVELYEDGTEERTYTINGLPEGKYEFRVEACKLENANTLNLSTRSYGQWQTIDVNAAKKKSAKKKKYDFSKAKVGDIITFGSYEQDDDMLNGKEPIEWLVISKTKKKLLVISKNILDWVSFNYNPRDNFAEANWSNCTLRTWLNDYFYKTAFTKAERKKIKKTWLKSSPNPTTGENGGSNTEDKIFLLSYEEITSKSYGYDPDIMGNVFLGNTVTTAYARAQGANYYDGGQCKYLWDAGSPAGFWLRTSGSIGYFAMSVYNSYWLDYEQSNFGSLIHNGFGVRPVMYISLK